MTGTDRNTCRQTQTKGAGADRIYRALADWAGKRRSSVACESRIASGRLCLSWRDGPDVGRELAVDEARLGQVPPLVFVLFPLIGSLTLIAPALLVAGQPLLPARGERLTLFWVGELQVAGFLICSIIGLAILPAGRAIVLAYTMPLWAIPIGLFLWPEPLDRAQLIGAAIGFAGLVLFMNPCLVDWGNGHILAGNALLLLAADPLGAGILPLSPVRVAFAVLGPDLLAARGQHRSGRGYCADRRTRWTGALVAGARCNPRLQLHRYDSPRLFPVGKGVVDDAGSDRRTSADADTDRRFRAVYPHVRRSGDSGCPAQRRINRRRHFRNSATVILTHCPPSARAK